MGKDFKKEILELMEERQKILDAQRHLNEDIAKKSAPLREQIEELLKEDQAELLILSTQLTEIYKQVESLMIKHNIRKFPTEYALVKYAGNKKGNIEVAQAILKPEIFKRLVTKSISATSAAKVLDPEEMNQIFSEPNPSLKFNKPDKKIKEISYHEGVKQVVSD
jgi:hypothetical protein